MPVSTVSFKQTQITVAESDKGLFLIVQRSLDLEVSDVNYQVVGGSATAGSDYELSDGVLHFERGEKEKSLVIPIIDDSMVEPSENIQIQLMSVVGGQIGADNLATVTITDNDTSQSAINQAIPNFSFHATSSLWDEGMGTQVIQIDRTGGIGTAATVEVVVNGGTATLGQDYTLGSAFNQNVATISFAGGDLVKTVSLTIVDDAQVEGDETIEFILRNPSAGSDIGPNTSNVAQIFDNDTTSQSPGNGNNNNDDKGGFLGLGASAAPMLGFLLVLLILRRERARRFV